MTAGATTALTPHISQQKWSHVVQIEEVRANEAATLERLLTQVIEAFGPDVTHRLIEHDGWFMKIWIESWTTPASIDLRRRELLATVRAAYRGPRRNISAFDGPALAPGGKPQFRSVRRP